MATLTQHIDLMSSSGSCRVFLHGAQVVSWTPTGQEPVLWLSPLAQFDSDRPIRGGVPVVFPWFGAGVQGDRAPAHGFARLTEWSVVEVVRADDRASAVLELQAGARLGLSAAEAVSPDSRDAFTRPFSARLRIQAAESLDLALEVTNTGSEVFTYEAALHTYLAVSDVQRVRVEGLDGCEYVDQASAAHASPASTQAAGGRAVQKGPVTFSGEVDRIYACGGNVGVVDPGLRRTLLVRTSGSASTIVWNPGEERAATMPDISPAHWRAFVCIEGGNVRDDAVTLAPGESHSLGYSVAVKHHDD